MTADVSDRTERAPSQPTQPTQPTLAALRGEAAALHERTVQLEAACRAIERELAELLKRDGRANAAQVRRLQQTAQESVAHLRETVRRRTAVRARIAEMERTATQPVTSNLVSMPTRAPAAAVRPAEPPAAARSTGVASVELPSAQERPPSPEAVPPLPPTAEPRAPGPAAPSEASAADPARAEPPRIVRQRLERLPTGPRLDRLRRALHPQVVLSTALGGLLIVLLVLLTPLPELFGWQLYAVETGSMEPAIPVGSVVAVRPVRADALRIGDVITFSDRSQPDARVTHRIVNLEAKNGQQSAVTKGDANNTTDSWSVPIDRDVGRVEYHIAYAGYVMYWLGSPSVKLAALIVAGLMFFGPQLGRRRAERERGGTASTEPSAGKVATATGREPSVEDLTREIEALLGSEHEARTKRTAA